METKTKSKDIRDYLQVIIKRRWLIITIFLLIIIVATIQSHRKIANAVPIYKAVSRIVFESNLTNQLAFQDMTFLRYMAYSDFQTQLHIIKSAAVATEVANRLNLSNHPEFSGKGDDSKNTQSKLFEQVGYVLAFWKKKLLSIWMPSNSGEVISSDNTDGIPLNLDSDLKKHSTLVSAITDRINVKWIENTRLVDIGFSAQDPVLAARIANEIIQAYIELNIGAKLKATQDAIRWLTSRMEKERAKVESSEIALLRYKEEQGIISGFSMNSDNIDDQKLTHLGTQLVEVSSRRVEEETRYRQALELEKSPENLVSIPEVLKNELIQEIKKLEVQLYNRMSELSKKYGKNHPQMKAIASELADLKTRRTNEIKRIVNSLRSEYRLALAKENSLKKVIEAEEKKNLELNKKAIRYRMLQHQAESSKQMYEMLLGRLKETSLTKEVKTGDVRIVDKAVIPKVPLTPSQRDFMRNAFLFGLVLSLGAAFLLEYIDNTFKDPNQVKQYLDISYLGPVPAFEKIEGQSDELVTLSQPRSNTSESFRGIRTSILLSSADAAPHVIMVTSAGPREGKTSCVANLSIVMAQAGAKVLLIDCDMRRPRVHKIFLQKQGRSIGLTNVLTGSAKLEDAILPTKAKHLDILPCGAIPPNPSEIIGSRRMKDLLENLKKRYTRIMIDTPPVMSVTDSVILSRIVDGVVVLIRIGDTPRQVVQNAVENLKSVRASILGAVLNGIQTGKDSYYYYQYGYYYYGYGEEQKQKRTSKRKKRGKDLQKEKTGTT